MYDLIVLAGGAARRLGGVDKPALEVGGVSLLDRVLDAAPLAGRTVVVGPQRPLARAGGVVWRQEEPAGAGPVAAIAAGFPETRASAVLVLAADLPWIAGALAPMLTALPAGTGFALLVDAAGRPNYLAAAWRRATLGAALAEVGGPAGTSMRALVAAAATPPVLVPDEGGWGRDCDTWDDLDYARDRAGARGTDREGS